LIGAELIMTNLRRLAWLVALLSLNIFSANCQKQKVVEKGVERGPLYQSTGNEGGIVGTVVFQGAPPAPAKISMKSDPVCAKGGEVTSEEVLIANGKLQNVFVYVKSGLPQVSFPVPTQEVVIDQNGCRFAPHILGIQTGQTIKVINSDGTSHSIHPTPKTNKEWNETQYMSASPIIKKFSLEEVMIPVKCNLHSWMRGYIGVLSHPYFAVTGADGTFALKGLPPGEYELEAWHEKFGAKTLKVQVREKSEARGEFHFGNATAYQPGTLKVQPAFVVH
jgi:plastocyanin